MPETNNHNQNQEPINKENDENPSSDETEQQEQHAESEHYEGMVDDAIRGAMSDDESS